MKNLIIVLLSICFSQLVFSEVLPEEQAKEVKQAILENLEQNEMNCDVTFGGNHYGDHSIKNLIKGAGSYFELFKDSDTVELLGESDIDILVERKLSNQEGSVEVVLSEDERSVVGLRAIFEDIEEKTIKVNVGTIKKPRYEEKTVTERTQKLDLFCGTLHPESEEEASNF